jgi:D-alanine transaminase
MSAFVPRAGLLDGMIYLQLTRGPAPRSHVFPQTLRPTLLFYARPLPPVSLAGSAQGTKLHSVIDERWSCCWIKSIALLANTLAKNLAVEAGADEAVFIADGIVTECAASNFFAVIDGQVITHPVGPKVLPGITRLVLADIAQELHIPFVERPLRESEALSAAEVFITSTTRELSWVSHCNGQPLAEKCGPITLALHRAYQERVKRDTR